MTTTDMSPDLQTLLPALAQEIQQHYRVPIATYRLQLHAGFTFTQAQHLIPYLHALGISDCYTSPYLQARPGSPHGYDVTNPQALNAEIGTEADYTAFTQTLQHYGMGHVLTQTLHTYNGTPGQPASFDRLHALLEAQSYRLSDWRTATDELNYRRFFDIVHLAGVRTGASVNVTRATGQTVLPLATALAEFPVALLHTSGLE